jgi:hypothetical protein
MNNFFRKALNKLNSYRKNFADSDFINHNYRYFGKVSKLNNNKKPEVLFEFNRFHSSHIAYSYLANVLAVKYDAKICAYATMPSKSILNSCEWLLSRFWSGVDFAIYRSFGVSKFFKPQVNRTQLAKAKKLTENILRTLKVKSDIESISLDGICIGDLIYDSYLRFFSKPTIEIKNQLFKDFLLTTICVYVFWNDYFNEHDVRAVNASHCVYVNAIPLRIAISRDIPAFVSGAVHVYRLSKKNLFDSCDFFQYRKIFKSLPLNICKLGLENAKEKIEKRFSGKIGIDMQYVSESAFGAHKAESILIKSNRPKVLIATHCFFDSPHNYGNNLFPDFYEWLNYLGQITLETDYDWYIKTHPDYLPGSMEVINSFIEKYPKFRLLSADSSHHQIIAEGIDVALTCYGTIAFEYAALGIPVINASLNNPHIAYNFNLHPKNIDEYGEILKNIDQIDLHIDKNEVYEYYFMKNIYTTNNWLFDDYSKMINDIGGYYNQYTSEVYKVWIQQWNSLKHSKVIEKLNAFVDNGEFRLR